jgi:hypothetical protein
MRQQLSHSDTEEIPITAAQHTQALYTTALQFKSPNIPNYNVISWFWQPAPLFRVSKVTTGWNDTCSQGSSAAVGYSCSIQWLAGTPRALIVVVEILVSLILLAFLSDLPIFFLCVLPFTIRQQVNWEFRNYFNPRKVLARVLTKARIDMRRLTTGIRSEKRVERRFRRCANVVECTYTKIV